MTLTWLSQSGYLIEHEGHRLLIDPCLSNAAAAKGFTRAVQAPIGVDALAPQWLICTHCHVDHWDPISAPEILRSHPASQLLAPTSVRRLASAGGLPENRFRSLDVGSGLEAGPFQVMALPTIHGDPYGVGLLISTGEQTLYHSGDTEYSTVLAGELRRRINERVPSLDLALLCINGRHGNMTWQEAVLLAEQLRPRLVVPHHHDLFLENQTDPQPFVERCVLLGLQARSLSVGLPSNISTLLRNGD